MIPRTATGAAVVSVIRLEYLAAVLCLQCVAQTYLTSACTKFTCFAYSLLEQPVRVGCCAAFGPLDRLDILIHRSLQSRDIRHYENMNADGVYRLPFTIYVRFTAATAASYLGSPRAQKHDTVSTFTRLYKRVLLITLAVAMT